MFLLPRSHSTATRQLGNSKRTERGSNSHPDRYVSNRTIFASCLCSRQVIKADFSENITLSATVSKVQGQQASLRVQHLDHVSDPSLRSLRIVGRAAPTKAEQRHVDTILGVLQGKALLLSNRWMKILFPSLPDPDPNAIDREDTNDAMTAVTTSFEMQQASTGAGWNVSSWTSDQPADSWQAPESDGWATVDDPCTSSTGTSALPSCELPSNGKLMHYV